MEKNISALCALFVFALSTFCPEIVLAAKPSSLLVSLVSSSDPVPVPESDTSTFNAKQYTYLQSFQGKPEVSLFSGALNYSYPLWVPKGRLGVTPSIPLRYSSLDSYYGSPVGYGWNLPINAIYRTPKKGTDQIYNEQHFTSDIFGDNEDLIIVDDTNNVYAPIIEGSFSEFTFNGTSWVGKDAVGNTYTFGQNAGARQDDPNDSSKVYKWMLEKVEDPNGNFITLTYTKNGGAVYPDTIRYTGSGSDQGLFEVKFNLVDRDIYTSYRTNFQVDNAKLIDSIDLITYESGSAHTFLTYDFDYTKQNNAIWLLNSVTVKSGSDSLPPTSFEYYAGDDVEVNKKLLALKKITGPYGSVDSYTYKPAAAYREPDSTSSNMLPFVTYTVLTSTQQASASDAAHVTNYDYRYGDYYVDDMDTFRREYAGFGKVTVTDPAGNVRKIFFHQDQFDPHNTDNAAQGEYDDHISKKGRIYRDEQYDDDDNLRKLTINKWDKSDLSDDDAEESRHYPFLARTTIVDYGENAQSKASGIDYTYDSYGNQTQSVDYGQVTVSGTAGDFADTGSDKITTTTDYAYNTTDHLLRFPKIVERVDQSSTLLSRQKTYYDGLTYGQVNKGNATKTESYKNTTQYVTSQTSYTSKGLPEVQTNPRNYDTTITYDSFDLYPSQIENAKSQITEYEYNTEFGVPTEITDPNGGVTQNILDTFGRLDEEKVKSPSAVMKTVKDYSYDLSSYPTSITETDFADHNDTSGNPIQISKKSYFDGYNRPIQNKAEAEGANSYVVSSTTYDERGNVKEQYLPKASTNLNYQAVSGSDPKTTYTYDPLNRVKTVVNSLGTTSTAYNDWSATVTDPNTKQKTFIYDARQNLLEVKEYVSSTPYSTYYEYNGNNLLTKITDAAGNLKNISYDLLGRKLSEELFHLSSNGSPKSYVYTYDDNGNLQSQTDAKNQTINYGYDELDRISTENTNEVVYTYDAGINGIGRLSSVDFGNGEKAYTYDILGRVLTEEKTLDSQQFDTDFTYDLLGNVLSITYPNSTSVSYGYNNAGQLEQVTNYVDDIDYSPMGQPSFVDFANGVMTTNTYDPTKLYRLTHKVTNNGTIDLQDISYTYDPVGNITNLVDASDTNAGKTAAYGYDDLYRLTSATVTGTTNTQDYTETFTYDVIGNMLSKTGLGTYTYAGVQPHAVTGIGSTTYSYDDNGSLTGDGTWTHSYDDKNRLASSSDGTTTVDYEYDQGSDRTVKDNGTARNVYVNKYYETEDDGTSNTQRAFVYAGDMKVAKIEGSVKTFHHLDHLSGSNVSTDISGAVVELNDYYPYGDSRIEDRASGYSNDYEYTGKEKDEETDLYYYGARYYDPVIGRFTSVDPLQFRTNELMQKFGENPQALNSYSYVLNRPLVGVDFDGEEFFFMTTALPSVKNEVTYEIKQTSPVLNNFSVNEHNQPNYNFDSLTAKDKEVIQAGISMALAASDIWQVNYLTPTPKSDLPPGVKPGSKGGPGQGKDFSKPVKDQARIESDNTCVFCHQETTTGSSGPQQSHIDHAIPKNSGGNNTIENAQNTCRTCNLQKGIMDSYEFLSKISKQ